jgi:hypothetical protein
MEIFGGFMVMMSIIGLFLAVIWLVMPFVVFAIKGKQDRILEVLEGIEKRLTVLENSLQPANPNAGSYKPPVPVAQESESGIESHEDNIIVSREPSA